MESHLSKRYTLADLEPGWPEDLHSKRLKTSPRMHGSMTMALRRVSRSPENSRSYVHGDPVQLIDWVAYARSDDLIVREHRDEASSKIGIVIEPSETMKWPSMTDTSQHGGIDMATQKIEIAIRLAIYLAHAHLTVGDSVSIGYINKQGEMDRSWHPRSPTDVIDIFQLCLKIGFESALDSIMSIQNWQFSNFDLTWWLSDFLSFEGVPQIPDQSKNLRVLHVFSWLERSAHWMDDATSYRDESRGRKIYLGHQLRNENQWIEAIDQWQAKIQAAVKKAGGRYLALDDKTNVGDFFHWISTEALRK